MTGAGDPLAFREALVTQARLEAEGVLSLTLAQPGGAPLPGWDPGAHIDLRLPSGTVRQYSLCGDPEEPTYTVAVLREPDGRGGSAEVHDTALVGRAVEIRGPRNHFPLAADAPHHLFLAGGIGVTPLLAMARHTAAAGASWELHYGGRTRAAMAFTGELTRLGGERVHLVPQDEHGLLPVDALIAAAPPGTAVYCCGPEPMLAAVESACAALPGALHTERFGAPPPAAPDTADAGGQPGAFTVELRRSGLTLEVPAARTLLDVVREAVPDVPYSCEEGFCGSCETRVLDGTPEHHCTVLLDDERAAGETMMICVGRSLTPLLALDL